MGNDIWIVSAKRTPIGRFQGQLQGFSAPQLGAFAIKSAAGASGISQVDEVYMGCVFQQGAGKLQPDKHRLTPVFQKMCQLLP